MKLADHKATLSFSNGAPSMELPVYAGTIGPNVIDIRKLYGQTGMFTYDPGFLSTASCQSAITYIDGDKGELLYRGYPIEQLATQCDYLDTCYLLLNGELPNEGERNGFHKLILNHTMVNEQMQFFLRGFRRDAHPMAVLTGLIERAGLAHHPIPISGDTRISLAVFEQDTGEEYRFVPEGPELSEAECEACLAAVAARACDWLVLSGSLPRGMAEDFYARLIAQAKARGVAVVLDTSGPALKAGLAEGGVRFVKPSLSELESVAGHILPDHAAIVAAARRIVTQGGAHSVAVTLGSKGAVLVEPDRVLTLPAIEVAAKSATGAGDSFVAAMTYGLAAGWQSERAFRYGLAAGAAAAMTPGTDLAHAEDIEQLAARAG